MEDTKVDKLLMTKHSLKFETPRGITWIKNQEIACVLFSPDGDNNASIEIHLKCNTKLRFENDKTILLERFGYIIELLEETLEENHGYNNKKEK